MPAWNRSRHPRLRRLRLRLATGSDFQAAGRPLTALREVTLEDLPPRPWAHHALAAVAPHAGTVNLGATGLLWLDGTWGGEVTRIGLEATTVTGSPRLPGRLDYLRLHLGEDIAAALLQPVRSLGGLSVRGTPVTDDLLARLRGLGLSSLDVVGTRITPEALRAFQDACPATGVLPRVRPAEPSGDYRDAAALLRRSPTGTGLPADPG